MSAAAGSRPLQSPVPANGFSSIASGLALLAVWLLALAFVIDYAFRYYLNYNEAAFTDPVRGSPNFWTDRFWLLAHISGGILAILAGPWQFWSGFRARYLRVHQWTGRLFLLGVVVGALGAARLAIDTPIGWAYSVSLLGLTTAWVMTTATAYYAILRRRFDIHKVWMIRAYVVTFAFVLARVLLKHGPFSQLQPDSDRFATIIWLSWTFPLLVTEVILQLTNMRRSV